MKTTNYTMRVLQPEDGKFLTQAKDVDILERIITADKIYLAANAEVSDWIEISAAKAEVYEEMKRLKEKEMEEQDESIR
jgi:hypothetical protein